MGIKAHTTSGLTCLRGAVPVRRRRAQKASRAEASTAAAAMAACSCPWLSAGQSAPSGPRGHCGMPAAVQCCRHAMTTSRPWWSS